MRIPCLRHIIAALFVLTIACPAGADETMWTAKGQRLYVPAYSHVYQGAKGRPYQLAIMLSIRNVDEANPITITTIKYYDDHGALVKDHLTEPMVIAPMATREVYIRERDSSGGSGANFIVSWESPKEVHVPVVQTVMIGTASTQGISFVCDGVILEEK
ncbi:DUF3124 domain-containing protein [Pseudodesulfovibrio portus]|jgi:hypothetical protein|uniref:DUF3124 domain-containing protein n=1 Tax=Pseudodesulfovibrio portus TaxID=231439 RepID=A0ABM8AR82_9BACT|nr:DUF3124 domain-containing protein [Pseudodesulfovibrio portus]BDQ33925.1 hypothetical protein JCM14722_14670 [Pseudodesulfovibrio portus]